MNYRCRTTVDNRLAFYLKTFEISGLEFDAWVCTEANMRRNIETLPLGLLKLETIEVFDCDLGLEDEPMFKYDISISLSLEEVLSTIEFDLEQYLLDIGGELE